MPAGSAASERALQTYLPPRRPAIQHTVPATVPDPHTPLRCPGLALTGIWTLRLAEKKEVGSSVKG
jgi:hypothetical protein